jgi:hypothetical protein
MPSFKIPKRPVGSASVTAIPASMGAVTILPHSSGVKSAFLAMLGSSVTFVERAPNHDDFGVNQSKIMNIINFNN